MVKYMVFARAGTSASSCVRAIESQLVIPESATYCVKTLISGWLCRVSGNTLSMNQS